MTSFDTSASYYRAISIEERADGTHVYLDGPPKSAKAKVRDAAPTVSSLTEADPKDVRSGQQPATAGFVCDFRRSADGRWTGNAGGRKFRLRISHDNSVYRVEEDKNPPWAVKMGDAALASPERALSDEQHQAGLSRWQQLLDLAWRRKEPGEAA